MKDNDRITISMLFIITWFLMIMFFVVTGQHIPKESPTRFVCVDSITDQGDPFFICDAVEE